MLFWIAVAFAGPDVSVQWTEPTCADEALVASAGRRAASVCGGPKPERTAISYRTSAAVAGCEVWLSAWCPAVSATPFVPAGSVTVPTAYIDKGYVGLSLVLSVGKHELAEIPFPGGGTWADRIDSVKVPAGYTVRLCHEPRGMGRCTDLVADHAELGMTYVGHDDVTSIEVVRGTLPPIWTCPRVFWDDGFRGKSLDVCDDLISLVGSEWNDKVSSVAVPPGWTVQLCQHPDLQQPCKEVTTDQARLLGAVTGDQASSIKVTRPK